MRKIFLALLMLFVSVPAFSKSVKSKGKLNSTRDASNSSSFMLKRSNIESLSSEMIAQDTAASESSGFETTIGAGLAVTNQFTTSTQYFDVDFSGTQETVPVLSIGIAQRISEFEQLDVYAFLNSGFSTSNESTDAVSSLGVDVQDTIKLEWIPLFTGVRTDFDKLWSSITPSFSLGLGTNWVHQSGQIDGIDQTSWIPMYSAGAGLRFFGSEDGFSFGGLVVSLDYLKSTSKIHSLEVVQIKMGTALKL
jgi:hypothetical protein